jgi:ABC-type Fe3+/spermidine/putrescine transport system ATPase subunit
VSDFVKVDALEIGYSGLTAVDRISFTVGRGEHVTLLGPSGCGKTTTLRAIAGLETPRGGLIQIDGAPVFDAGSGRNVPPEKRGLSMVFQSYAIWPHMTVFDNVAFGFRARGFSRDRARPSVERALALVDLAAYADRSATKLSGGQQQRVALARAIAYESKVILLDEPLSNLDAQLRITMRAELGELRRRLGFTAIYVTHDQEEAFALSDRIIVMRAGMIEQQGTPAEIHGKPRTRFVAAFLGMKNILNATITPLPGESGVAVAQIAPGIALRARDPWGQGPQSDAALSFRPIDVHLATDRNAPGQGGSGVIRRRLFLGDLVHYYVDANGTEICAYDRPRDELAEGATVEWRVAPESCLVLRE